MDADERRQVILDEVRHWRAEGIVDSATADFLESRYAGAGPLPGEGARAMAPTSGTRPGPKGTRGGFATNALQFVGGLLLGAALVALMFFMDLPEAHAPWVLFLLSAVAVGGGLALHALDPRREGLGEALLAAGLVPAAVSAGISTGSGGPDLFLCALVAVLAVVTHVLRRGSGPAIILAGFAFSLATFLALDQGFFVPAGEALVPRLGWLALLLGYLGLLLAWRHETWSTIGLALFVVPLTFSFIFLLEALGVHDSVMTEVLVGLWLAGLLAVGIVLGNRGLVTGAAAGLTIDASIFAFDLGGAGTAVVVLLILGGVLVWQAEFLRSYFARGPEDRL